MGTTKKIRDTHTHTQKEETDRQTLTQQMRQRMAGRQKNRPTDITSFFYIKSPALL